MIDKKEQTYIAKTAFGLEEVLNHELKNLGIIKTEIFKRAVEFHASLGEMYKANLALRTAFRILKPLFSFKAKTSDQLYKNVKNYDWTVLIKTSDTFAIDGVVNSDYFKHSKYAALKVKDAIVDQIRDKKGKRPNVDIKDPTIRFNIHIENDNCSILLDSSGDSLHKRGYRLKGGEAPLNEILAAGMILLSEWNKDTNFVDPMCGSGTLLIEAALIATNTPPNIARAKFGFMNWKSFDQKLFNSVKAELESKKTEFRYKILGNEINKLTLDSALQNAKRANVGNLIEFLNFDFFDLKNELSSGILITNPPYGERMQTEDLENFYKKIGDKLKKEYTDFDAWILSANKEAVKRIGLRTSKRLTLFNGSLECKYFNYKMYEGSKKQKYNS